MNESILEDRLKQLSDDILGGDDVAVLLIIDCVCHWLNTCERIDRLDSEHVRGASLLRFLHQRLRRERSHET